jgi:thymidylate synthase
MAEENALRGDGKLNIVPVYAENLAEATHKAIIACHDYGLRVETPKHREGISLGYDADMPIRVGNPDSEPKIYFPGIHDDPRGLMQYILEVTHGIHNHWKKDEKNPDRWGYTYNERFVDQIPFILQKIKEEVGTKKYFGRGSQFSIWRSGEDIVPEQPDPPCLQRGQFRFIENSKGELVMNYFTDWRSRDLLKAWNENNLGQIELMKLFAKKVSSILEREVKLGAYIDHSSSLHLYGLYVDRDGLKQKVQQMKKDGWEEKSMSLDDYLGDRTQLKRLIACQLDAEAKGHGLNQSEESLKELGYDIENFPYPEEWDTWPKSWDAEPDRSKFGRGV